MKGWLDKYQGGGKVQAAPIDSSKTKTANKQPESQLPIYYGPTEFENCQGAGCSKIATTEIANTFGMNYGDLHPQDAWYRRASVLKNKGKEVWNPSMGNNYSGFKVGDLISLNRPGDTYEKAASKTPGYTIADNEGNEHVGEIVGRTKEGIPLIKHGSEHGKIYVQPINNIFLSDAAPVTLKYKPQSVYRLAELENAEIKDKKFYTAPQKSIPIAMRNPNVKLTANEKKYIDAINANAGKQQQMFGLSPEEAKMINTLGYGIFHNESNAGNTSWKRPVGGKMLASELAHAFGRDASPSLGDVQFKYDDAMYNADKSLSSVGKRMQNIGVKREGLSDWTHHRDDYNDEVNSVAALMSDYLDKFKNDPKYKYDAKKKTIFGDVPLDKALINIYHFGPAATKEKFLRNAKSYSDKAMKYVDQLNYTPEAPKNISISKSPAAAMFMNAAKIAKKENGGWLDKYNDGGPVQPNYNDASVSYPPDFVGDGYNTTGRNYSPAWGGQFAMGGSLPGATGHFYARYSSGGTAPGDADYNAPRTINPAPSNGPYAKKTKASAQNGITIPGEYELMQEPDDQINYDSENPAFDAASMLIGQGLMNSIPEANSPAIDININQRNLGAEHTFTHQPGYSVYSGEPTDSYMLKRTVTPYTTDEDVRLNTLMPTSPRDVNFISNYAGARPDLTSEYPTSVPYEGEKHWNIDRFAIDPQFSSAYPDLENTKSYTDKTQQRRNTLADMYKYFMLQNKGNRDVAWKQANEFMTKEIDPRISGPVYDLLHNSDSLNAVAGSITNMIDDYYLRNYNSILEEGNLPENERSLVANNFWKSPTPASPQRAKDLAIDWLVNYKKMSPKQAETYYKKLPKKQNGGEMKYYQEGLDFRPKTISKNGSVIKDDRGQWAHPGEITEIGSNQITMQGVPYPVLGISDTGDTQMMYPNQDYTYEGSSVTEYPMMKEGGALQLTKLDQLLNFTNYNTKQPGGWLDKYQD